MLANSQNTPPDGYYECLPMAIDDGPCYIEKEAITSCYIPEETLQIPGQTKKKENKKNKTNNMPLRSRGCWSYCFSF